MKGTGFLRTAYHEIMETVILLFLLAMSDKNANLKETLESFLKFYRENRELIAMLSGGLSAGGAPQSGQTPPPAGEREKNPPSEGKTGSLDIIEEYLRRRAV